MKKLAVILALVLVGGFSAHGQLRLLIVDQTKTIEESMRLEALARGLLATGEFFVRATLAIPTSRWEKEPFHFVLVFPTYGRFVWLCTPGPLLQRAQGTIAQAVEQAFSGSREVRTPGDDLYPLLLSFYFQYLGVLVGAR